MEIEDMFVALMILFLVLAIFFLGACVAERMIFNDCSSLHATRIYDKVIKCEVTKD